jgi:small subunit ribosomal protein S1
MKTMKKTAEKNNQFNVPKIGEIVQGKIIARGNGSLFLDLGSFGTGIIYGKEFYQTRNKIKDLKIGSVVSAKIIDFENEDGYIELSVSEAKKEIAWQDLAQKKEKGEILNVKISGANKGGLMADVFGIPAFLPVSQLSTQHYPKIENGDVQKIFQKLQKFIGQEMKVKIIDFNPHKGKLILSEKAKEAKKIEETLKKYKVGDIVETEVSGIADFGVFVKLEDDQKKNKADNELEGLIHISELSWRLVKNPSEVVKPGQKIKAKIINIADNKLFLSLKALEKDPWENIEAKYKKGDIIEGKVTKISPFGALVELTPEIQGLCHISEFSSFKKMEENLKAGEKYKFQIYLIESDKRRISLKLREE